jgi:hypothetical protein
MQRFQVPYQLRAIPEVQQYLQGAFDNSRHHGDLEDLYRRRFVFYLFWGAVFVLIHIDGSVCSLNPDKLLIPQQQPTCDNCSVGRRGPKPRHHHSLTRFHFSSRFAHTLYSLLTVFPSFPSLVSHHLSHICPAFTFISVFSFFLFVNVRGLRKCNVTQIIIRLYPRVAYCLDPVGYTQRRGEWTINCPFL